MSIELCERGADGNAKGKSQPPRATGPGVSNNRYYACAYVDSGNTACNRPPVYNCEPRVAPNIVAPGYHRLLCQGTHNEERVKENECRSYYRLLLLSTRKDYSRTRLISMISCVTNAILPSEIFRR